MALKLGPSVSLEEINKKQKKEKDTEEVGFFESALAGVATGLWNIPKGIVSLGAEIYDLTADTNLARDVEEWFDNVNPFDDEAEARTVGKITQALTQIGLPAYAGARIGVSLATKTAESLAKKAVAAKQAGKVLSLSRVGAKIMSPTGRGIIGAGVGGGAAGLNTSSGGGYNENKFGGSDSNYDYSSNVSTAQLPKGVTSGASEVKTKEDEKKAKEKARDFRQINYNTGYQPVTFGDRINAHNVRKRNAYIKRILQQRQDKITSGLLQSNVPGIDVMDTKDYFSFVPSVKKYGPDGTGKYSQEFIDSVLSNTPEGEQFILGDRAPPEFFIFLRVNH